jgi:hypothetical protein
MPVDLTSESYIWPILISAVDTELNPIKFIMTEQTHELKSSNPIFFNSKLEGFYKCSYNIEHLVLLINQYAKF